MRLMPRPLLDVIDGEGGERGAPPQADGTVEEVLPWPPKRHSDPSANARAVSVGEAKERRQFRVQSV